MTHTLTLTAAQLASIASLHNATPAAKSDRDMSPILTAIALTVEALPGTDSTADGTPIPSGYRVTATATDRYTIGRLTFDVDADRFASPLLVGETTTPVALLSTDLVALSKLVKGSYTASLDWTDRETDDRGNLLPLIAEHTSGTTRVAILGGNLPPVGRLIPTDPKEEETDLAWSVRLDLGKLARLGKLLDPEDVTRGYKPDGSWAFSQKRADSRTTSDPTGQPVILRRDGKQYGKAWELVALIQPNRLLR